MPKTLNALMLGCVIAAGCAGTTPPRPAAQPAAAAAPSGASSESPGEVIPDGVKLVIEGARDLALGSTQALTVLFHDADGNEHDVTGSVVWQSSNQAIVAVNGASRARAMSEGSADITAIYRERSAKAAITVGPAIVTELALRAPESGMAIFEGGELGAVATYSDGHTADVTTSTWWTTSDARVAFPIAANAMVRATGGGTATIGAWYGGVKSTVAVTVNGPALMGLAIDPPSLALQPGDAQTVHAIALFADSTSAAIPQSDSRFVGDNAEVVYVDHQPDSAAVITAVGEGHATVRVTFAGFTATTDVQAADPIHSKPL